MMNIISIDLKLKKNHVSLCCFVDRELTSRGLSVCSVSKLFNTDSNKDYIIKISINVPGIGNLKNFIKQSMNL